MKTNLEDRVVKFASRCIKVCIALLAKRIGSSSLADQIFRSATSIAANYAEASESESRKDFIHKIKIAMKELSETRVWLKIIGESEYIEKSKLQLLIDESVELTRTFSASIITVRSNRS